MGRNTPGNFRFAIRLPLEIIGGNNGTTDTNKISDFLEEFAPLEEKVLAIVIRTSSKLTLNNGREWLDNILDVCTYYGYSIALEFDHFSWFQDLTYSILKKYNVAIVWSSNNNNGSGSYPVVTADFLYLRISQNEKKWIEKIKERETKEKELDFAIVVVEQPSTANYVLKLVDLSEKKYGHSRWLGRVIMSVNLNAFYPSCEELRDPALKGKPHAVIMTDQQPQHIGDNITKGVVASCSYEARKSGVMSAMALDCTKKILEDNTTEQFNIEKYATRIESSIKQ
jgi:DNA polymerase IV (archaeal DinB-like DNA polymerase)